MATLMPIIFPVMQCDPQRPTWTCRGGSHALVHALCSCFAAHGGRLFTGCPVDQFIMEGDEVKGVVRSPSTPSSPTRRSAAAPVVSNLSCHPTFRDLIGEEKLPDWVKQGVDDYKNDETVLFTNYWVLDKPPHWEGYPEEINTGLRLQLRHGERRGHPASGAQPGERRAARSADRLGSLGAGLRPGRSHPGAAKGQYTMMSWSNVPYKLPQHGGPEKWDEIRESYGDKVDALLREYNPGMMDSVVARYCNSPLDYYRKNPSMVDGQHDQRARRAGVVRDEPPLPRLRRTANALPGLYLSNSIWPFGTSNLGSGYVAASVVAEDLGVRDKQDWWRHKAIEPGSRSSSGGASRSNSTCLKRSKTSRRAISSTGVSRWRIWTRSYDVIVIGGGPNGLTATAYLARAGAKVLMLERHHEGGGGLVTEEWSGFRFNTHAKLMLMMDVMPPYTTSSSRAGAAATSSPTSPPRSSPATARR